MFRQLWPFLVLLINTPLFAKEIARGTVDGTPVLVLCDNMQTNRVTSLTVKFEKSSQHKDANFELLAFDARMPEHNHGMLLKPRVSKHKGDEFVVEGVKLHMRGQWEFLLKVKRGKQEFDVRVPYLLP